MKKQLVKVLHTLRGIPEDATAASIAVAAELRWLTEHGAISEAALDRLAQGLSVSALRQLARTVRKDFEVREAERKEIEAEQRL